MCDQAAYTITETSRERSDKKALKVLAFRLDLQSPQMIRPRSCPAGLRRPVPASQCHHCVTTGSSPSLLCHHCAATCRPWVLLLSTDMTVSHGVTLTVSTPVTLSSPLCHHSPPCRHCATTLSPLWHHSPPCRHCVTTLSPLGHRCVTTVTSLCQHSVITVSQLPFRFWQRELIGRLIYSCDTVPPPSPSSQPNPPVAAAAWYASRVFSIHSDRPALQTGGYFHWWSR